MKAGPFGSPQRKSNREPASATSGSDERRKRATTVLPDVFVKLTKNRPLVAINCTALLNDVAVMNDQFISLINRFPQIPEDLAIDHRIAKGGRAVVTFRNTTGVIAHPTHSLPSNRPRSLSASR